MQGIGKIDNGSAKQVKNKSFSFRVNIFQVYIRMPNDPVDANDSIDYEFREKADNFTDSFFGESEFMNDYNTNNPSFQNEEFNLLIGRINMIKDLLYLHRIRDINEQHDVIDRVKSYILEFFKLNEGQKHSVLQAFAEVQSGGKRKRRVRKSRTQKKRRNNRKQTRRRASH